jgi:hypothetical protein
MLRALASSARPLGGWRASLSSSSSAWSRAFSAEGSKEAAAAGGAVTPTSDDGGASGSSGSGGGGGGGGESGSSSSTNAEQSDHGWSEVVDNTSGKSYWWNQQTGQTTDLGASRPGERFWRRPAGPSAGGGDDDGGGGGSGGGGAYDDSDPHFRDAQGVWREPPGRDRTWTYSVIGVGIGMAAGWLTQYIH